jgi:cellulose synthase/poly-beta-1,6-N-acetylglucosamine synthase-like glycosyltransferase
MMLEWLGNFFVALTVVGCAFMAAVVLAFFHQLRRYHALRPGALAREQELLARALPPDDALPHVVVQLPSFNEGPIVERSVANATQLDWPRDKLHVQVCDDSTDATIDFARAAAQRARADGFDVVVLHRDDRTDYKAGALHEGLTKTTHDYFLILDVDYISSPDVLRRCMTVMLARPEIAFVQARLDFFNAGQNPLTRAQRTMLDFHYGIEQAIRGWGNQMVPFNGTCGIWRRAAIAAGGGWSGATVSEDMDLSYRAWLKGWRGVYMTSIAVSGELPARLQVWMAQQRRWAAGVGEVAVKMLPVLFSSRAMPASERLGAAHPLASWFGYLMVTVTIVLASVASLLKPSLALLLGLTVLLLLLAIVVALFVVMRAINRLVHPGTSLRKFIVDFLPVPFLALYISWANFRSLPKTLLGRRRVFARTPKTGATAKVS